MKKNILLVVTSVLSLLFASCAAGPNTQSGALTGAAIGGLAGAIIGNNVGDGDAGRGALIGAAVGLSLIHISEPTRLLSIGCGGEG